MKVANIPGVGTCKLEALKTTLIADPGDQWNYGINIDWAGKAVERVSGLSLDGYVRERIFAPLGMKDTVFILKPEQHARVASVHARGADGKLNNAQILKPNRRPDEQEQHGRRERHAAQDHPARPDQRCRVLPRHGQEMGPGLHDQHPGRARPAQRGSLAWAGLANTYFWLDPKKKVAGVILTQILPFADQKALQLLADFESTVYKNGRAA
jgi:methyl acetate hydrolase